MIPAVIFICTQDITSTVDNHELAAPDIVFCNINNKKILLATTTGWKLFYFKGGLSLECEACILVRVVMLDTETLITFKFRYFPSFHGSCCS